MTVYKEVMMNQTPIIEPCPSCGRAVAVHGATTKYYVLVDPPDDGPRCALCGGGNREQQFQEPEEDSPKFKLGLE